jgi:hypothetical protein
VKSFAIHWSPVPTPRATSNLPSGFRLLALWPSPVNHDACFRDAGFTEFADNDADWSIRADALLDRLLAELARHGEPRLVSEPIRGAQPWLLRPFRRSPVVDLQRQITLPIQWDSLPDCVVAFGGQGATLRAGNGHHLFWLTLPAGEALDDQDLMRRIAGDEPCFQTSLRWEFLL